MPSDTADLETFARTAAQTGEPCWIEVVDLGHLPVDDPDALDHAVADVLREYVSRSISRFFRLPDRRVVLVSDIGHGREIDRGLRALADELSDRHDGRIETTPYQLPRDIEAFLAFCGEELRKATAQTGEGHPGRPESARTWGRRLSDAIRTAQSLVHADLSAYVLELPVRDLTRRAHPPMAVELAPSFTEVARALGAPIDADPWMARHLAGLIHGRVLQQVRNEPWRLRNNLHLNALPETIRSSAFDAFARDVDAWARARITLEIPARTAMDESDAMEQCRTVLETSGFRLGLDDVQPDEIAQVPSLLHSAASVKIAGGRRALAEHAQTLHGLMTEYPRPVWTLLDAPDAATRHAARELGFTAAQARSAA